MRDGAGHAREIALSSRYVANEGTAIRAAVLAGLGIASLPSSMCSADIAVGALARVCPDWIAGEVTSTLLMPHRRGLLPSVRVVTDLIVKQHAG